MNTQVKPSDADLAPQERSLLELYRFQSMPHAIGIDSAREDMRNMVQLMMELSGYEGTVADMKQLFDAEIEHLEDEIETLEDAVEDIGTDKKKGTVLKAAISKKKQRLNKFFKMKEHVEAHEKVLEKVGKEEDVSKAIDIQQTLTEDVHDFYYEDILPVTAPKKSVYAGMAVFDKVGQDLINTPPSNDFDAPYQSKPSADGDESGDGDSADSAEEEESTPEVKYEL